MTTPTRTRALELAIDASTGSGLTAAEIVAYAKEFFAFMIDQITPPVQVPGDAPLETSETEATPPAKPAKAVAAAKAAPKAEAKAADPAPAVAAEKPAGVADKPAAKGKEATEVDAKQSVVKLVTKVGREETIKFMQRTFGSPNVSGLDLTKHSYAGVVKKIGEYIAEVEQSQSAAA